MFYFPIITGNYPEWFPFLGGQDFIFFRPVFNIADSSITIGIFSVLLFYRDVFNESSGKIAPVPETGTNEEPPDTPI